VEDWDGFKNDITKLVTEHAINLVLPTCEEVFHLARLWNEEILSARLYAPPMRCLSQAHNKFDFIQQAARFGLPTPNTRLLLSPADICDDDCNRVLKPVWSRFGETVLLQPSLTQLRKIQPSKSMPWISQEFLAGREICATVLCEKGHVLGLSAYHPLYKAGKGAGIYFDPVDGNTVAGFVETYAKKTNWSGQISFDFMQTDDGHVLPLECNPRSTSGLHFFRDPKSFTQALLMGKGMMEVSNNSAQAIKLAMLSYGLSQSILQRDLGVFVRDYRRSNSALSWADDARPNHFQLIPIVEFAVRAIRHRCSLLAATTRDIQWDGPQT
jgi:hypothetical protein